MKNLDISLREEKIIQHISEILDNDGLAIIPTDTVYGLICDFKSKKGVKLINNLKNRSESKMLSILLPDTEEWKEIKDVKKYKTKKINKLLKLGCTVIMPISSLPKVEEFIIKNNLSGLYKDKNKKEEQNIGIRIPSNKTAVNFLKLHNRPVIATSVNFSNKNAAQKFSEIDPAFFERVDFSLESDKETGKTHSSVVDISTSDKPNIIREGNIKSKKIISILSRRFF